MDFLKKSKAKRRAAAEVVEYDEVARSRLRSISERGGYDYDEAERSEVEARLRRMFYGAKVEGSKAEERDSGSGSEV